MNNTNNIDHLHNPFNPGNGNGNGSGNCNNNITGEPMVLTVPGSGGNPIVLTVPGGNNSSGQMNRVDHNPVINVSDYDNQDAIEPQTTVFRGENTDNANVNDHQNETSLQNEIEPISLQNYCPRKFFMENIRFSVDVISGLQKQSRYSPELNLYKHSVNRTIISALTKYNNHSIFSGRKRKLDFDKAQRELLGEYLERLNN